MRTCIIQKNNAPASLVRFTEVKCFFDYKNEFLKFFDEVVITEDADDLGIRGWKINAGQYITGDIRDAHDSALDLDLRNSQDTINFDPDNWSEVQEMKQYRGKKQEYIFREYMVMILKSKSKMLYFSNNELMPDIKGHKGDIWVPASGDMAGRVQYHNPDANITVYDINPVQLKYSQWLNSQAQYPASEDVYEFIKTLGKISLSEKFESKPHDWIPVKANYVCVDILEKQLTCPTLVSNILEYMPAYYKHGGTYIQNWKQNNLEYVIRATHPK